MRVSRRIFIASGALAGAAAASRRAEAAAIPEALRADAPRMQAPRLAREAARRPVVTLNGWTLPWRRNGVWKEFHLVAEPVTREVAPGLVAHLWGYNGQSPGPTIECVEGEKLRIFVSNKLPEPSTIHWQGLPVASGMTGLAGVSQPPIEPGQTFAYELEPARSGTFIYRPHADQRAQSAMGLLGMLVVHPRDASADGVDRDFALLLNAYELERHDGRPSIRAPLWTCNGRMFPGIDPLVLRKGDRARVRVGNLGPANLPLEIHGHAVTVTGTGAGRVPESARWPDSVIDLPAGAVRVVEFTADAEGDWALHCALPRPHTADAERLLPRDPASAAVTRHASPAPDPPYLPAERSGLAPFGAIGMGPIFTLVKVRAGLAAGDGRDPGWYRHPPGTRARAVRTEIAGVPTAKPQLASGRALEVKVAKPHAKS